jgi:uncharacterized BrkB/YihY/UPF0761 family membrane protein
LTLVNTLLKPLGRIAKPYNKIKVFWVIGLVLFMALGAIVTIFADIGLSIAEKTMPNYLHGKYLNYDNLWLLVSIWTVTFPAFMIIATISLMTHNLPISQSQDSNQESKS